MSREQTRRLIAEGVSPDEAARAARLRLGNAVSLRERSRDIRLLPWLDAILRDARFGVRMLRKDAVVSGAAVASLALAMGAAIAAFILIDALILRPLPVPSRTASVYLATEDANRSDRQEAPRSAIRRSSASRRRHPAARGCSQSSFQGRQAFSIGSPTAATRGSRAVHARATRSPSWAWFRRWAGCSFGRRQRARRASGGRGQQRVLDPSLRRRPRGRGPLDHRHTLACADCGVAPPGFTGVTPGIRTDVWVPMTMYHAEALTSGGWQWLQILGRLAPASDATSTRAVLQPAFTTLRRERARQFPATAPRDKVRQ